MTHAVKIIHSTHLPGPGWDRITGVAKNGKQFVQGVVNITSYTVGGELVTPAEFGLEQVDFINFGPIFEQTTAYNARWEGNGTNELHVTKDADAAEITTSTDIGEIGFLAVGDSSHDVELL